MNAFLTAWRVAPRVPLPVLRGACSAFAWAAWARQGRVAKRLEDNLHRVTGFEGRRLRRLSRRAFASTARYYSEVFEMERMTPEQFDARLRIEDITVAHGALNSGSAAVGVLSHSGNWDIVGGYAARHIIPVVAVAEILKPRQVFDEFVAMRESVGMTILGHEGGATFRKLLRIAAGERALLCLVADRDISGSGIEVDMWGQRVKVAPGPAAVCGATGVPLVPIMSYYERLHGARRRAAGSKWGVVLQFGEPLDPADFPKETRVQELSQAWATWMAARIKERPQDWHMLQRFGWVE
ncbi:phosphatidylinositol mannoside acyltransferase [uncultured Demequina sp.]|uniref:phosphatidylinositol mannoside acyltransferase n=1 Tax=uncultured Demequina sp. TaxID=693499 RepID=UPI0025EE6F0F|nr:phosphatidylinositol mannoside acyltransferase [uncultured Demequina sp.]